MEIEIKTHTIRVYDEEQEVGVVHADNSADFLSWDDAELVDKINGLHDDIEVEEDDLPPNPIELIQDASDLEELKEALGRGARPEQSRRPDHAGGPS